jgi:PAS domain S-box-containing protein
LNSKDIILAVDDAPESLMMLTDTLTAEGYDVHPADSGELALASVSASRPELILLDLRMPGMDGLEVCRRLKAATESRDIPLIFLSATTETSERVEGLKLGAVDFISKPFHKEELLARIQTHLELSRLRNRLEELVTERTENLRIANEQLRLELADRLRAEQALRESEERFRSMADNAPVVIWTSGPDTTITFVNRYGLTLTGRTLEEFCREGWKEVVHPDDLELRYPECIRATMSGREYRVEYRVRRADGEYRWMLDTATPRRLANGCFAGYIGIAIDITDLKQGQEQLMAAQKLESLGVLVGGIAHNLNNLMATIIAEADLALSDLSADSGAVGSVERISSVAIRVADLVFLMTAYAGTGVADMPAPVDLSAVVEETLQLLRATVSRNIRFSVTLASKLSPIRADISRIRQLVMNLLTNACESLPDQEGSVAVNTSWVHISPRSAAKDKVRLPAGDYVQLCVTDTGCGIPAELQGKIFDPFYTTKFVGRGLGLSAVLGIVRSLDGDVWVRSSAGRGSTFTVLIPCIHQDGVPEPDPELAPGLLA